MEMLFSNMPRLDNVVLFLTCICSSYFLVLILDLYLQAIVLAELFINVIIPVFIITLCYTWIIVIIWRRESATLGCHAQKIRYSNGNL